MDGYFDSHRMWLTEKALISMPVVRATMAGLWLRFALSIKGA